MRRSALCLALAACAPSPADTGADPVDDPAPQARLGLCDALDVDALDADALTDAASSLDEAAGLGLGLARPHRPLGHVFAWNLIAGADGSGPDDWTLADLVVGEAVARRQRLLATVVPEAQAAAPEPGDRPKLPEVPAERQADWQEFLRRLVERYDGDGYEDAPGLGGGVLAWEIGNEPDCAGKAGCVDAYVDLVELSARAIHSADPDALVLPGGAAPTLVPDGEGVKPAVSPLYQALIERTADDVDAFSLHVLVGAKNPPVAAYLAEWKPLLGDAPLWITEIGSRNVGDVQKVSDDPAEEAAWADAQLGAAFDAGVERVLWCRAKAPLDRMPAVQAVLAEWAIALTDTES